MMDFELHPEDIEVAERNQDLIIENARIRDISFISTSSERR